MSGDLLVCPMCGSVDILLNPPSTGCECRNCEYLWDSDDEVDPCEPSFEGKVVVIIEFDEDGDRRFLCPTCNFRSETEWDTIDHIINSHPPMVKWGDGCGPEESKDGKS